ncbi:MAG: hypothetical protein LBM06_01435 [Prevotellaceae bacterium]|jgi:hypothetical protein|nr:hypothetical protein [Prevotellaceae bacterium]
MKQFLGKQLAAAGKKLVRTTSGWKWGHFFSNFLAVVLGIILTFAGNNWLQQRNTQRDLKTSLQLIKDELNLNRENIAKMQDNYLKDRQAAKYLLQYQSDYFKADHKTLAESGACMFRSNFPSIVTDALEMLKSSGLLQKITDRKLAVEIIKTYSTIKSAKEATDSYYESKRKWQYKLMDIPAFVGYDDSDKSTFEKWTDYMKISQMVELVESIPNYFNGPYPYNEDLEAIDEAITAIDRAY